MVMRMMMTKMMDDNKNNNNNNKTTTAIIIITNSNNNSNSAEQVEVKEDLSRSSFRPPRFRKNKEKLLPVVSLNDFGQRIILQGD